MNALRFYYDFSCPWSYLALVRLQDVADRNATRIELRPVIVDTVLTTENPPLQLNRLAMNPAKAAWQRKDLELWAQFWGITIKLPAGWPVDSSLAAAAATVIATEAEHNKGVDFSLQIFAAYFSAGKDISSADILADLAADIGLHRAEFLQQLTHTKTSTQVNNWTEELIRQGGFGTPSVFIGDQLFFGNDRISLVDWAIGPISEDDFVMPGQHG
ncbi:MAG: hypothetical protein GY727_04010 [Gammaproteobacteria bacterium]|nr:hypothetical protein [Gammaproteobacteria bacterium]MCP4091471.1 hypothetical protein [Gammaproteobacteria bacterium]MCP4275382.1 hypothetical protein [Gammaproteobacteria bacterium]MCP4832270.1 hypothetical protein [Gammaproteobacteria bacterium]MCP4928155.1 hypothetical protein [Gammaproteobacteria bacterium]